MSIKERNKKNTDGWNMRSSNKQRSANCRRPNKTFRTGNVHSGYCYKDPYKALCAAMINSMVLDLTGDRKRLCDRVDHSRPEDIRRLIRVMREKAKNDLLTFKTWALYQRAMKANMPLPNDEQIKRIISMKPRQLAKKLGDISIAAKG